MRGRRRRNITLKEKTVGSLSGPVFEQRFFWEIVGCAFFWRIPAERGKEEVAIKIYIGSDSEFKRACNWQYREKKRGGGRGGMRR